MKILINVENLNIVNPSGIHPHYLGQNYIMKVVGDDDGHNIEDIDIIRSLFPDNKEVINRVNAGLAKLKSDITQLTLIPQHYYKYNFLST